VILATKFGLPMDDEGRLAGGSRRYVLSAVETSLKRLRIATSGGSRIDA
jgi:aryl-alcohol dehydrogenase-like predicted oxidoreductase